RIQITLLGSRKGIKENKSPVSVNSLMMHEMSQALGLDTELNPSKYPDPFLANLQKKRLEKSPSSSISNNFKIL
ncbi:hypothetical protein TNCT_590551, partial [Trichonephila clavata]